MICHKCSTQYPDMCDDCKEVIHMDFTEFVKDDVKQFEDFKVVYQPKRINIASGEDMPLLLEI